MSPRYKFNFTVLISLFILVACAPFQDSPFSDQLLRDERNLNSVSQNLTQIESDGKIRIALFSDSHQNYKDLDRVLFNINETPDIDFVVNLGDITNSGYNFEYNQFLDSLQALRWPVLSVLGNHDAIGAGVSLFHKIFGPPNFIFESNTKRFIFFNNNNLEDPEGFSPSWLLDQVKASAKPVIIFSHVNLKDIDRFFNQDAQIFDTVIQHPNVQLTVNGHNHVYSLNDDYGTTRLEVPRVEFEKWILLEIQGNDIAITRMPEGSSVSLTLKH